ncbi:hypothetical protein SAMN06297387_110173 [Streptomyces zhaozhouensis]|uniref:Uncharacterized protein n=1 Tax=Streptomyces zhaozhouensis TaxID=1300267 RepID=A0A286DXP9_9ACTN|nr:hypothetical protein [Streptomyces zhaozhouensis]SOD63441.1 hypothetical protein SAMN06297387_110173 [Streptomyces zhaozhouensis]
MPDRPEPTGPADHFDRLLARHTPVAPTRVPRVRPRLPGPFERVESLRADPGALDPPGRPGPVPFPSTPERARDRAFPGRPATRETRTEHHTVERAAPAPGPAPGPAEAGRPRAAAPGERAARVAPVVPRRAAAPAPAEPAGRAEAAPARAAGAPPGGPAVRRAPVPSAPPARPPAARASPAPADALRAAAARRSARPPERVVRVRIGRLEVNAAPPPRAAARRDGDGAAAGRAAPTVSLRDFLAGGSRGREGEMRK